MATAAELLAGMSTGDDTTLVIDNYLRTIHIPKRITNLGVEHDDEVLTLNFKMPRYLDDTDLSKFAIRINYINANGDSDAYTVNDSKKVVTTDHILFSWLVGPTATAYKGTTKFIVCMKTLKSDGTIDKEYNTTIASLPVLEGLEVEESIVTQYSDIIEQWRQELFGIGDTEEADMRAVSQEEQENIVKKGAEVLATIPEEYQETAEAAQEGIRTKADAIVCTAEGNAIAVSDSSDDHLRGLRVFGKTTQISTTGTQLFNPYAEQNNSFGTAIVENNGSRITVTGTYYVSWPLVLKAGVTYYINFSTVGAATNRAVRFEYSNKEITGTVTNPASFTPTKDTVSVYLYAGLGTEDTIIYENVQISEGSSALPWEPYSGGVASPSPDWPQDLDSVNNTTVDISGGNLFDFKGITATNDITVNPDGTLTVTIYSAPTGKTLKQLAPSLKVGSRYKLTLDTESTNKFIYLLEVKRTWDNGATITMTDAILNSKVYVYGVNGDAPTIIRNIAIVPEGVTYDGGSYVEPQYITVDRALSGISDISDEIDFERGVYVRRVNRVSLTGVETYGLLADSGGEMFVTLPVDAVYTNSAVTCMCNYYPSVARQDTYDNGTTPGFIGLAVSHGHARITDNVRFNGDSDALRAWVTEKAYEGKPLIIDYILATPIETPLTAEELEAFKTVRSSYPSTTVQNDSRANMELKYNVDTKTYVDNGIKQTVSEVMEAIENGSY
jgi:hypothetical protein